MISGIAWPAFLVFFSSLSINLILQCGLGMAGIVRPATPKIPLIKIALGFITILILWLFFAYIVSPLAFGFFGYILFFPAASLVYRALEYLFFDVFAKGTPGRENTILCNDGLLGAALFLTYNIAGEFSGALAMIFGFSLGVLLTLVITAEISRRSEMETVPRFLKGGPLIIISMGLLSMVFGSVAFLIFRSIATLSGAGS